jgi:hypothetical protein
MSLAAKTTQYVVVAIPANCGWLGGGDAVGAGGHPALLTAPAL